MADDSTTRVYVARKFITMDDRVPSADAVAVRGSKVIAVGSLETVKASIQPIAPGFEVDFTLEDKVVTPGLIDNHLHPYLGGALLPMEFIPPDDWELPRGTVEAVRGKDAFSNRLRELESNRESPDEWLFTWGFSQYFHGEIDRSELDRISNSRPVVVWHRSFHELYMNSAAMSALGISESSVADEPQVDWNAGHFYETGLLVALTALTPILLEEGRWKRGLFDLREMVHRGGITTIADMSAGLLGEQELAYLTDVFDSEGTPFRTYLVQEGSSLLASMGNDSTKAVEFVRGRKDFKGKRLQFLNAVKLFADGAFFSQAMQMKAGYLDGHDGEWMSQPDDLLLAARSYWNEGFQIHVHVNGDLGVEVMLDILDTLRRETPRDDHRFTLHHVGYCSLDQVERIAELGAVVSANPYYIHLLGELYSQHGLGPDRATHLVRSRSLLERRVALSLHSDMTIAPAKPLLLAWCAVNRLGLSGGVLGPEERISVHQALRAVTLDAAFALRKEDEIGSIEVGKFADLTVLEDDPYSLPPEKLKDISVWGTMFEGDLYPL
jgi:hypothetical protein